ncbi:MAG: hypothetical protein NWE81_01575 [Candidatus Bathyarchaeota archaeon]|nr:hypothetical protein [Candidatus Bathyarchaeota archaeon]
MGAKNLVTAHEASNYTSPTEGGQQHSLIIRDAYWVPEGKLKIPQGHCEFHAIWLGQEKCQVSKSKT